MGIQVYFLGVCTHLWWKDMLPAYTSRVVLVNAAGDDIVIDTHPIHAHLATLRYVRGGEIKEQSLDGAWLSLANSPDTHAVPHKSFDTCIPKLGELTQELGVPSKAAVDDGVPALAACIFELRGGTLRGYTSQKGASYARFDAESDGPLVLTSMVTRESTIIEVDPGSKITVSNLGSTENDDHDFDFLLHYKLAAHMPEHPENFTQPRACITNEDEETWPPHFGSVGPGCSNSAYP